MFSNFDTQPILDLERYNGRVNIMQSPDPMVQFRMAEKIHVANVATDYRGAVSGIFENNVLSQVYFSAGNIQILQNGMRAGVYEMSNKKYVIPNQNIDNLKIIMRSIYLQHAEHDPNNVTKEVERLNKMVLDYCVPSVFNEAVGYERYRQDQSSLVLPLSMPQQSDRDYKQLEIKHFL
jgi:hypothetical protein